MCLLWMSLCSEHNRAERTGTHTPPVTKSTQHPHRQKQDDMSFLELKLDSFIFSPFNVGKVHFLQSFAVINHKELVFRIFYALAFMSGFALDDLWLNLGPMSTYFQVDVGLYGREWCSARFWLTTTSGLLVMTFHTELRERRFDHVNKMKTWKCMRFKHK